MLVEVHGIKRNISFTTKDGTNINGTNIYVEHLENGVEGCMCEKYFLNGATFSDISSKIKVGDMCVLNFNRYGKVAEIIIQDKK